MEKRKELEIEFSKQREVDRQNLSEKEYLEKYPNRKLYVISDKVRRYQEKLILSKGFESKVLDYCCGAGQTSLKLAQMGYKDIYGIDICKEHVEASNNRLISEGYYNNGTFNVMDAENTTFPNDYFDLIVCNGVLHHLDFDKALIELARILKKDGKIVLNGCVQSPILDKNAKLDITKSYLKKLNFTLNDVISVGDGANDVNLIKQTGIGVSYKGKQIVNNVADVVFNHTNLKGILYLQDYEI